MPAIATHYQFGQIVYNEVSLEIKKIIDCNKDSFDVGLQGPDILFYHQVHKKSEISKFGHYCHTLPGYTFFKPALAHISDEEIMAYVFGLCCHYALDSDTHPYINSRSKNSFEHQRYESSIDYAIIKRYKLSHKRHRCIRPKNVNYDAISLMYPSINVEQCKNAVYTMRNLNFFLNYRKLVVVVDNIIKMNGLFSSLTLDKSNPDNNDVDVFFELFEKSVGNAVKYINQIYKEASVDDMQLNFEGIVHEIY